MALHIRNQGQVRTKGDFFINFTKKEKKQKNNQFTFALSEVGIYKRKQESKIEGKHAFDLERKKKRKRPRKSDSRKKKKGNGKRKLELNI